MFLLKANIIFFTNLRLFGDLEFCHLRFGYVLS